MSHSRAENDFALFYHYGSELNMMVWYQYKRLLSSLNDCQALVVVVPVNPIFWHYALILVADHITAIARSYYLHSSYGMYRNCWSENNLLQMLFYRRLQLRKIIVWETGTGRDKVIRI